MVAPMVAPIVYMPIASARSRAGNHSDTAFDAAGQIPASPSPNMNRHAPIERTPCAQAVTMFASDHQMTKDRGAGAGAEAVHQSSGYQIGDGVGDEEQVDDVRILAVVHFQVRLDGRREHGQRLAVHIVQHRGQENQHHDPPA